MKSIKLEKCEIYKAFEPYCTLPLSFGLVSFWKITKSELIKYSENCNIEKYLNNFIEMFSILIRG